MSFTRINLTDTVNPEKRFKTNFELINKYDGDITTLILSDGRTEEINGKFFIIENGDYQVTDSGIADGTVFIHIKDNLDGTGSSFVSALSGTYNANKGGWYNGNDKVIYSMTKSGTNYSNKGKMLKPNNIGQIISIHPDTLFFPNIFMFSPCDGVELLPTTNFSTVNDTKVPNLTDNRFLQGASVYGVGGNANNQINVQHTHTIPDATGTVFAVSGAFGGTPSPHTHTITTDLTATQDIRPQYFNLKYYIRIN